MKNILTLEEAKEIRALLKANGKKVVFTNGCFDILHAGHVDYLTKAKAFGDCLIVALNTDSSIKRIKGELRPIVPQNERAIIIAALKAVDYVIFFEEDTPFEVIKELVPDILIKGADWSVENIVGADIVLSNGGKVETIEFVNITSTTNIIDTVLKKFKS